MSLEPRDGAEGDESSLVLRLPPMDDDMDRERGPLEGKFVEVIEEVDDAESGGRYAASRMGWATQWNGEGKGYLVETLNGGIAEVPDEKIKEFEPTAVTLGGFDLAWPPLSYEDNGMFSSLVADCLAKKGYCVIQCTADAEARESMFEFAYGSTEQYTCPKREFREAYLGRKPNSRICWLEGMNTENAGLMHYNGFMKNMHKLLLDSGEEYLGLNLSPNRMGTMVRTPFQTTREEKSLDLGEISSADVEEGLVESFLEFVQRRRFCMMYMVTGAGGDVELVPRPDLNDLEKVKIDVEKDRLLLFRHDMFSYQYTPEDVEDLVLQTWVVDPPNTLEDLEVNGAYEMDEEEIAKDGPPIRPGFSKYWTFANPLTTWITSFHCRCSANIYGDAWCAAMMSGASGTIETPSNRWDVDIYYDEDGDFGKTRTKHTAYVQDAQLADFDHEFFDWSYEYAARSPLYNRLGMEIPYMNMVKAGLSKKDLQGQHVPFYVGSCGDLAQANGDSAACCFPYWMDMCGRNAIIDTACSAALTATSMAHNELVMGRGTLAFTNGVGLMMDVGSYIAMSSGRMISSRGRSFTFDHSADGYGRGEGWVSIILETIGKSNPIRDNAKQKDPWEIIRFLSSAMNQDGKSASLTAPSGPAQTACIKKSCREADLLPCEVDLGECHGTGTALGDPIEVGSSRIVNDPYVREVPWFFGASKSQTGHLEMGAGIIGIMRVVNTLSYGCYTPNIHLYQLNEHFSLEGYPCAMPVEAARMNHTCNIGGVNSFGFGGTNCRHEYWARSIASGPLGDMNPATKLKKKAPQLDKLDYITVTCPQCLGSMCWVCGVAIPKYHNQPGKHFCSTIREDFDRYDVCSNCYTGDYIYGQPDYEELANPGGRLWVVGSWSNFKAFEEMQRNIDGDYEVAIRLGETRMESFQIGIDASMETMLHPIYENANQHVHIQGPDQDGAYKYWVIDGHLDGAQEGSVYLITFSWSETTGRRLIKWEPCEEYGINPKLHTSGMHAYQLCMGGTPARMVPSPTEDSVWTVSTTAPWTGKCEFWITRDGDDKQEIYPAVDENAADLPSMGPDSFRCGRKFRMKAQPGQSLQVKLFLEDASMTVTAATAGKETTWSSMPRSYALVGSWTDWQCTPMETDPAKPGVYKSRFYMGDTDAEQFQILQDMDWNKAFYPKDPEATPGVSIVCGPEAGAPEYQWMVYGEYGQEMEVTLDLTAADHRLIVTCEALETLNLDAIEDEGR